MNPFKKKKNDAEQQVLILDSCGLIDGRIVDIARIGFVPQNILIPQFIIAELQFLADHGDSHKRERARYGLDVIRMLQDLRRTNVAIAREQFKNIREVDDKLIALAKQYGALLYTTDFNLNKVAQIEGVEVLNVNELAQAMRPNRLPGEKVEIKITQVGQDRTQGVGYLEDGTMVVVEKAGNRVGQKLNVEFSRMLQTAAGKMMFAVLPQHDHAAREDKKPVAQHQEKAHHPKEHREERPQVMRAYHAEPAKPRQPRDQRQHRKHHPIQDQQQQRTAHPKESRLEEPKQEQRKISRTHNKPSDQPKQPNRPNRSGAPQQRNRRRVTPEDSLLAAIHKSEQQ